MNVINGLANSQVINLSRTLANSRTVTWNNSDADRVAVWVTAQCVRYSVHDLLINCVNVFCLTVVYNKRWLNSECMCIGKALNKSILLKVLNIVFYEIPFYVPFLRKLTLIKSSDFHILFFTRTEKNRLWILNSDPE